jgi:LysM repeat protein
MRSQVILLVGAVLVAGCAGQGSSPSTTQSTPAAEKAGQPTTEPASPGAQKSPQAPTDTGPRQAPPLPPSAPEKAQAQELALHAAKLLDEGRESEARAELQKAQALDHENALAKNLMFQITAPDPVAVLGTKSFKYTVRPGDTLSKIADVYLKDQYKFYILARYNNINPPRSLGAGQVIQIPGTASIPPSPAPAPPLPVGADATKAGASERLYQEGQQAQRDGDKDRAYDLFMQAAKADPKDQRARSAADQLRPDLVAMHDRKAREAYRRQDLATSIKEWDRVLDLDPNNSTARLERRRAEELAENLKKVQ